MLEPLPLHPLLEVILLYAREFHLQTCVSRCLLPTTFCRRGAAQHAMLAGLLLGIRAYAVHRHRASTTYRTACALPGKGRVGSEKVFMCLCLPCLGAGAVGAYKVNKAVDRAFSSKTPEEPVEPAFVTEAKLRWNLTKWKPSDAPTQQEAARPKRSERYSDKEQQSRQRLAELAEAHRARSGKKPAVPPRQQTLRR
ncbi:hypothetical protein ABPG77_002838 [Micractinium sp. CCAP 211/92]